MTEDGTFGIKHLKGYKRKPVVGVRTHMGLILATSECVYLGEDDVMFAHMKSLNNSFSRWYIKNYDDDSCWKLRFDDILISIADVYRPDKKTKAVQTDTVLKVRRPEQ